MQSRQIESRWDKIEHEERPMPHRRNPFILLSPYNHLQSDKHTHSVDSLMVSRSGCARFCDSGFGQNQNNHDNFDSIPIECGFGDECFQHSSQSHPRHHLFRITIIRHDDGDLLKSVRCTQSVIDVDFETWRFIWNRLSRIALLVMVPHPNPFSLAPIVARGIELVLQYSILEMSQSQQSSMQSQNH